MLDTKKLIRTAQNYFPALAELKNSLYHITRSTLRLAHEPDFAVIAALPHDPSDLFLDVGGNRGQSILSMRKYRSDTPIVCFEPSPQMFPRLVKHFAGDMAVRLENIGLGADASENTLHVPSYRGFLYCGAASYCASHARTVLSHKTIYGYDPKHVSIETFICRTVPLDSLELAPSFIKIDVEGFELDVVRGGLETLRRHEPVILFERTWVDPAIFSILADMGYGEVVMNDGSIAPGHGVSDNAIMMTAGRLKDAQRSARP